MKIALVSPYDYAYASGVNNHVYHLAVEYRRMGHEVKIYAPCSKRRPQYLGHGIVPLGHMIPIPHNGSMARVTVSLWLLPKIGAILRREKFDVIHCHEPACPLLPWLFLWMSRTVNVGTFHFYGEGSSRYWFASKTFLTTVMTKLDGRTAVSVPAMGCAKSYVSGDYKLIHNGIDLDRFSSDAPPIEEYKDGKLNILFVGRLEKRKGAEYLVRAFEIIKREFPNSRLIVVGSSKKHREILKEFVRVQEIEDVVFAGYVKDEDLANYYSTADIFCSPAIGKESFGIVLLEGMAVGKPIVASNIGGYPSVVTDGVEGILVPPKDEDALAEAILRLLKDDTLRLEMGAKGKLRAQNYSWKSIAQKTMDYYLELLSEKGRCGRHT